MAQRTSFLKTPPVVPLRSETPTLVPDRTPGITSPERWTVAGLFVLHFALRIIYAFHLRADSDEPQHLHIIWGWTRGLLPYRDVFDNHPPLFHLLFAPLFSLLGERADIVAWMRLAMIPLCWLSLWCVYRLGRQVYDARTGLLAAMATAFFPPFFFISTQFRPDDLWTALWLLLLTTLLQAPVTRRRAFVCGLLLGTLIAVSMKTFLMICSLGAGAGIVLALRWMTAGGSGWHRYWVHLMIAGLAVLIVPVLFAGYFYVRGAWEPFLYGVLRHNFLPGGYGSWEHPWLHGWFLPPALGCGYLAFAWWTRSRRQRQGPWNARRTFFMVVACAYPVTLCTCWPVITGQDWLPCIPLLMVVLSDYCVRLGKRATGLLTPTRSAGRCVLWCSVAGVGTLVLCARQPPWKDQLAPERRLVVAALSLTRPDQFVMDAKGETIYRRRAFFYALEGITVIRMHRGLIADDIAARLAATNTTLVSPNRLTPSARAFVRANYLSVGEICVPGKKLELDATGKADPARTMNFNVALPAVYQIIGATGPATGVLDGQPWQNARWLDPGPHTFVAHPLETHGKLFLILARATELGFSPFNQALPTSKVQAGDRRPR